MTILMGDFNAKIGEDNSRYEEVMGTHGLGKMNENGEIVADLRVQQIGHRRQCIPPQKSPQGNLDITRPQD